MPIFSVSVAYSQPSCMHTTSCSYAAAGKPDGSSITAGSPPCAATMARSFASAAPLRSASSAMARHAAAPPLPASHSMPDARDRHTSVRSAGPLPRRVSTASMTSRLLPILRPNGVSISVMSAAVRRPLCSPMSTMAFASAMESSSVFMNAPFPVFTSSRMQSAPEASFLLMMLLAMSGIQETVAVTSRSAYIFLSAGARLPVCPMTAMPMSFTCRKNASCVSDTEHPGIASILSSVPPVCPRPRPLIFATFTPHAATIGPATRVVLSPTPPVECLSALTPPIPERSTISPL